MKLFTALFFVLILSSPVFSQHRREGTQRILDAICQVESSGGTNKADGDGGKAIGPFQIWRIYWTDATSYDKSLGGTYQDCRDRVYAEKVVIAYWKRFCPDALANDDFETLARVHNGGPNGAKKERTKEYWLKVQKALTEGK